MSELFKNNEKLYLEVFTKWKAKCEDNLYQAKGKDEIHYR